MTLIRTIFFIVVAYYLLRFIGKYLLPYFRAVTEMNDRQKNEQNQYVQFNSHKSGKSPKTTDGDYVDYKEVE